MSVVQLEEPNNISPDGRLVTMYTELLDFDIKSVIIFIFGCLPQREKEIF